MNIIVDGKKLVVEDLLTLEEIAKIIYPTTYRDILGAVIDNTVYNLSRTVMPGEEINFLNHFSEDGYKILTRTMTLVLAVALKRISKEALLQVEHFIGDGLYFEIDGLKQINSEFIEDLDLCMRQVIEDDLPIVRAQMDLLSALDLLEKEGYREKTRLLDTLDLKWVDVYFADGNAYSFHGYLAPSTGYARDFKLKLYHPGIVMMFPSPKSGNSVPEFKEERALAKIFSKSKKWTDMLGIGYVANLNRAIIDNDYEYLIDVSEAYFENSLSRVADQICGDDDLKIVLIAGPSSSGKTTTAHRLAVQMAVRGKRPHAISVDDYFIERSKTPKNEKGEPDYENISAIDLEAFNRDLIALLDGNRIELPKFNFVTGKNEPSGQFISMDDSHPVIIEGIHGLNPMLTFDVPDKNKFKIYISALTQLNVDSHNRISVTDVRLLRRIVRDFNYRGYSAADTLKLWKSVRAGEEKWIFPFQSVADAQLDSSLIYELAILKKHVVPLLEEIDKTLGCYKDAKRLLRFLEYFRIIEDESKVPVNSVLREFIGGRTV